MQPADSCLEVKHRFSCYGARDSQFTPLDRFGPFKSDGLLVAAGSPFFVVIVWTTTRRECAAMRTNYPDAEPLWPEWTWVLLLVVCSAPFLLGASLGLTVEPAIWLDRVEASLGSHRKAARAAWRF